MLNHPVQIAGKRLVDQRTHVLWKGQLVEAGERQLSSSGFLGSLLRRGRGKNDSPDEHGQEKEGRHLHRKHIRAPT